MPMGCPWSGHARPVQVPLVSSVWACSSTCASPSSTSRSRNVPCRPAPWILMFVAVVIASLGVLS